MPKTIVLKLAEIRYTGRSIGNDVCVEIEVFGAMTKFETKLKTGASVKPNLEIGKTVLGEKTLAIPATIRVTERDILFPDTENLKIVFKINPSAPFPQHSVSTIEVRESRGFLTKKGARFEIVIEASVAQGKKGSSLFKDKSIEWWEKWRELKSYSYRGVKGKEDYNRYDPLIRKVVAEWNKEFCDDIFPPDEPLDPNLVKAMIYQEGRVGYYPGTGFNVMQDGNPGDPSIRTLRGELKEYWIDDGKKQQLKYANAKVTTVEESVNWGVRWLYHKAYVNNGRRREWRSWREAVERYGPPRKDYAENVWSIYKKGIKKEKNSSILLWSVSIFFIPFFMLSHQGSAAPIKEAIAYSMNEDLRMQIEDIDVRYGAATPLFFYAIVEWRKDWWESLRVGKKESNGVTLITIDREPDEQSILKAEFLKLKGFERPVLEVYGQTHVGNGALYLYEIGETSARLLLLARGAVDAHVDGAKNPENLERYGYDECGEVFKDGALKSDYRDLNGDGISDLRLSGIADMLCEENRIEGNSSADSRQITVAHRRKERVFLWNPEFRQFVERERI
ncbi:MAG: hypothetical protein AAB416_01440 [Patescibacteria group bacterium]